MNVYIEDDGLGPRILLDLGGEEWVLKPERAIQLRDALTEAIDEIAAKQKNGETS
jgi:hypothetical protein